MLGRGERERGTEGAMADSLSQMSPGRVYPRSAFFTREESLAMWHDERALLLSCFICNKIVREREWQKKDPTVLKIVSSSVWECNSEAHETQMNASAPFIMVRNEDIFECLLKGQFSLLKLIARPFPRFQGLKTPQKICAHEAAEKKKHDLPSRKCV